MYAAEDKPKGMQPIDMLQVTRILLQKADEQTVGISRGTLSLQLCCGETAISESQKRLQKFDWITKLSGKRRGVPNRLGVVLDALPLTEELKRTVVSDQAKALAMKYRSAQLQILRILSPFKKPRFMKNSLQTYAFSLQVLLDKKCGGDEELLRRIISFASNSPAYRGKVVRGPHELRKSWKSLRADYDAAQAVTPQEAEAEAMPEPVETQPTAEDVAAPEAQAEAKPAITDDTVVTWAIDRADCRELMSRWPDTLPELRAVHEKAMAAEAERSTSCFLEM
jgi:hypothetical protein